MSKDDRRKWVNGGIAAGFVLTISVASGIHDYINKEEQADKRSSAEQTRTNSYSLRTKSGDPVPVARTKDDHERLYQFIGAGDLTGIREMILLGRAWNVEHDTEVLLIDGGWLSSEVRIQEGEHDGKLCWVANDFLTSN
jgi:hypothetical protein